jgi:hypothetical protein
MFAKRAVWFLFALAFVGCSDDAGITPPPPVPTQIAASGGNDQSDLPSSVLPAPLSVLVTDAAGNPVADVAVAWAVVNGGGSVAPAAPTTNSNGVASAQFTLGPAEGQQQARADATGLAGSPVVFTATATSTPPPPPPPPPTGIDFEVVGGGNNVRERFSSDLWVHGSYAYTGTWGFRNEVGNVLKIWSLGASGAPSEAGTITTHEIGTVSDVEVSADGQVLVFSGERGDDGGIYLYSLTDPATPSFLGSASVGPQGVHTVTLSTINGRRYAFAARNPGFSGGPDDQPALLIYDVTDPASPSLVATRPVPPNYGIHDTFVRDGLAFVFAWDTGVIIYDVGNGIRGGSPSSPVEVSRLRTSAGDAGSPSVHNGWWFHNPVTSERRYLFIGQEGPAVLGSVASGDIFVVDVSDLTAPREVAFFHLNGAGTHNFWMDEQKQILYAAFYNGGVVALDVSGTLAGNLAGRLLGQVKPGGAGNTFTWGVQFANGFVYASDMLSGLWQLKAE